MKHLLILFTLHMLVACGTYGKATECISEFCATPTPVPTTTTTTPSSTTITTITTSTWNGGIATVTPTPTPVATAILTVDATPAASHRPPVISEEVVPSDSLPTSVVSATLTTNTALPFCDLAHNAQIIHVADDNTYYYCNATAIVPAWYPTDLTVEEDDELELY